MQTENKAKVTNCKAYDMLSRATVLECGGLNALTWTLEEIEKMEDTEVVLNLETESSLGYGYEYQFTKEQILKATIQNNQITMMDTYEEEVAINLYTLQPLEN